MTVEGESCYFYRPNSTRCTEDYDSVVFEPFRPDGFEGDIEEIELPAAIDMNREIAELVVTVATEPYMDPDKLPGCERGLDSLCEEKTDEAQSMRYGMEASACPCSMPRSIWRTTRVWLSAKGAYLLCGYAPFVSVDDFQDCFPIFYFRPIISLPVPRLPYFESIRM